jgi:hypothetical protein
MTDQLKQLRLDIDGLTQLTEGLFNPPGFFISDETLSCRKSLYLAKAWAGKLLGELGDPTPYKNDGERKDVADIEPTDAQTSKTEAWAHAQLWEYKNHIEKVDWLHQAIQEKIDVVKFIDSNKFPTPLDTREKAISRTQIWTHLIEARLHLGFELERIRENSIGVKGAKGPIEATGEFK